MYLTQKYEFDAAIVIVSSAILTLFSAPLVLMVHQAINFALYGHMMIFSWVLFDIPGIYMSWMIISYISCFNRM